MPVGRSTSCKNTVLTYNTAVTSRMFCVIGVPRQADLRRRPQKPGHSYAPHGVVHDPFCRKP